MVSGIASAMCVITVHAARACAPSAGIIVALLCFSEPIRSERLCVDASFRSFGENELYDQIPNPPGSLLRQFQDFAIKIVGFTLPAFRGRGIFQYDYGVLPRRVPLHTG